MVKLKSTKAFKQTALQLGARRAVREFKKVRPLFCKDNHYDNDLCGSFVWDMTPQGYAFWYNIDRGRKPHHATI